MYPRISDFINDLFGTSFNWPVQSYGFFLSLAFVFGALSLRHELKRSEAKGLIQARPRTTAVSKSSFFDYFVNVLLSFIFGFKGLYIFSHYDIFAQDPQAILLSADGNLFGGVVLAMLVLLWLLWQNRKKKPDHSTAESLIHPHQHTAMLILIAAVTGIIGAKIFHQFENWDSFVSDPIAALLSFDGLTFYGGLITAAGAVVWYGRKQGIPWLVMGDAVAPALILGYGIGRIGCHVAGDGDWGIVNTLLKPDWLQWLPDWLWAYTYPHNVLGEGIPIAGCNGPHCFELAQGVFPTPVYETTMSLLIFGILLLLRNKLHISGQLFAIYLMLNGIERFLIEQIRVNNIMHLFGFQFTQAQLISTLLFVTGLSMFFILKKYPKSHAT